MVKKCDSCGNDLSVMLYHKHCPGCSSNYCPPCSSKDCGCGTSMSQFRKANCY